MLDAVDTIPISFCELDKDYSSSVSQKHISYSDKNKHFEKYL